MTTTWNASDKTASVSLSGSNLVATSSGAAAQSVRATAGIATGTKRAFSVTITTKTNDWAAGVATSTFALASVLGNSGDGIGLYPVSPPQAAYISGGQLVGGATASVNDEHVMVLVDRVANLLFFRTEAMVSDLGPSAWNDSASADPVSGAGGIDISGLGAGVLYPIFNDDLGGAVATLNAGGSAMPWTVPAGYSTIDGVAVAGPSGVPGRMFFAIEQDAYRPGGAALSLALGHGTHPHGALAMLPDAIADSSTVRASDMGYRTLEADAGGLQVYPARVQQAFSYQRVVNLDPTQSSVAYSVGQIVLSNPDNAYDAIAATWNCDGRTSRVLYGTKTYDATRGYYVDPSYATLKVLLAGMALPWFLSDTSLTIPLRDATYWLEQPIQHSLYAGTGGYEGPSSLAGTPKPKARGVCYNVTPTLIDPANLIYQYNDGPGIITGFYAAGNTAYSNAGDTTNLYVGTTPSGNIRTDNSRGLFQMGSTPVGQITCDVTGAFPVAGSQTTAATIARYLMTEDASVPAANVDVASFTAAASAYPYSAGVFIGSGDGISGVDAVNKLLSAFGAKLVPKRDGTLSCFVLRGIPASASSKASFSPANAVSVVPENAGATPYRVRVAYQHNYTVQQVNVSTSSTATHTAFIAAADRFAGYVNTDTLNAYRQPKDLDPVGGALTSATDAQAVANALGALLCVPRRVYQVTVPVSLGLTLDIGDVVSLTWPMDALANGRQGQIVGDTFRSADATVTFRVLV